MACQAPRQQEEIAVFSGTTMGTTFTVKVAAALDPPRRAALAGDIAATLESVDGAMSTYRDDSELMRFNRQPADRAFVFTPATFGVLEQALAVTRASDGAFDVAVGPLVNAWGFGPQDMAQAPDEETLASLLERIDARVQLTLDPSRHQVTKARSDVFVDLSGIAKGYAVDRVAAALTNRGVADFLVEVGGEMRARGERPGGRHWRVGVERPIEVRGQAARILPLKNAALATSGDYRNYRELEGARISHIIDPRTGRPIGHRLASASVVAEDCARADAWATALMVLGPEEGLAAAERHDIAALLLVRAQNGGFTERASHAFERLLDAAHPNPTGEGP